MPCELRAALVLWAGPPLGMTSLSPSSLLSPSGSPQEEASLIEHVGKLTPAASTLAEAGHLSELLVLLRHFEDAKTLQQELARWMAKHQVSEGRRFIMSACPSLLPSICEISISPLSGGSA